MDGHDFSRRSLLEAIVASLAIAAVPSSLVEVAEAAGDATLSFLSAAEAEAIDAVTARIIPTDDTPGAREAGVVYFIDRALGTFLRQLAGDYRAQLAEFQSACRARHPGAASFASLTPAQQVEYLNAVDHTPFFDTTRLLTLLGMFSPPAYGGNRNGVGWTLIGFEDRHSFQPPFGHYDRAYPGFLIDRARIS